MNKTAGFYANFQPKQRLFWVMHRSGNEGYEVGRLGENWHEFMDEFEPNTEAQKGPEVFAAQAGFACAPPGRSRSRRTARPKIQ